MNRQLRKWGEPPVLYSDRLTAISTEQIRLELNNRGYLNAKVDTFVVKENKKADVTYDVTGYEPYRIFRYSNALGSVDTAIHHVLSEEKKLDFVKEGDIFDLQILEKGRVDMAKTLRNRGYFNFSKDNFHFLADTTLGNNRVDLTLGLNKPENGLFIVNIISAMLR